MDFTCELCKSTFPADPNTMLEVTAGDHIIDLSGNFRELPDEVVELEATHVEHLGDHGICICLPCQKKHKLIT